MAQVQLVQAMPQQQRVNRNPVHTFQLRQRPWQIQPFMIAPVLPGETFKNALLQARVVTDPIKNPLIGWWTEYYFFYVKHRDLDARDTLVNMVLSNASTASLQTAAQTETYHYASSIDWAQLCLKRVTEEYFRDQGEAWNVATLGNLPLASINNSSWLDSVIDETTVPEGSDPQTTADNMETLDLYERQYEFMKSMKMINMTYEDFLKSYGVRGAAVEEPHKPELIRYVKDWTYPSNTVDPATGIPASAASWAVAERADKDRFIKEPGFIFGVSVIRPKVYLSRQKGAGVHMLDDAYSWLPAILANDPATSLKQYAAAAGPLTTPTNGYWVDVRDLFIYGDQFVNFSLAETDAGMVALPTAGMVKRFASSADADALFKSAAPANQIRQDGVVSLTILGTQVDQT